MGRRPYNNIEMKYSFDPSIKSPIKNRLLYYFNILLALLLLGCFGVLSVNAQHQNVSNLQDQTLPPLACNAPINPSWLQAAKGRIITAKDLEEPTVRVAYLIPSNRSPQDRGVEALQKIVTSLNIFLRDEMAYNGLAPKTFRYETEADGKTPLIHLVNIPETDVQIEGETDMDAWTNRINAARNAGLGVWQRGQVWLLVSESHLQQSDGSIKAGGALGASSGSANDPGVGTIPSHVLSLIGADGLTDDRDYNGLIFSEIGPYPLQQNISFYPGDGRTVSSITSVMLGAGWHELMHALQIGPHDFRNDSNFNGNLMGNGFRGIRGYLHQDRYPKDYTRLAFATAHALDNNHYFNEGKERNRIDAFSFSPLSATPQNGKLIVNVTAQDADGLSLIRLLSPSSDPSYSFCDFHTEKLLSGVNFDGQIEMPYFDPGIETRYIVQVYDKQGNKGEGSFLVTPEAGVNRAPWPYMRFTPPIGEFGDAFLLDATRTFDPDGDPSITNEWDVNNDGVFDTPSNQNGTHLAENLPAGNHLIRVRATNSSGMQTISTPIALHVSGETPPPSDITFTLINTGGSEVNYMGETFMADSYYDTGRTLDRPRTDLPEPYQSFRYSRSQQMSYGIPLADGEYTVNLHFAELWFGATDGGIGEVGKRVFDVSLEGRLAEDNLDVYAEVGAEAMLVKSHTVIVTDGVLDIDFDSRDAVGGERHPVINAIEIAAAERPFITTWKTGEGSDISSRQITIPTHNDETYNFTIDWGDGSSDTGVTSDITHTYASPGTYTISITGDFPRIGFSSGKLLSVDQWGSNRWSSLRAAFYNCPNLDVKATDVPDLSNVTSVALMFWKCGALIGNESFNDWNVGNVMDMGHMFFEAVSFDQALGNWEVGNVTDMNSMFSGANSFNQNIANWDVSKVTKMGAMFSMADSFNGDVSDWDVSNVTSMIEMFRWAASFDQDLGNWDVGNVANMDQMFNGASSFNQDIADWDVGKVTSTYAMFEEAISFDGDIGNWDVANVNDMYRMFFNGNLSVENYEKLLTSWSSLPSLKTGVNFHAGNAQYCSAEAARDKLTADFKWNIIDGGKTADCPDSNEFAIRINAGGIEAIYDGNTFMADSYYDTGRTLDRPRTGLPETYQSFRYSRSQQMSYGIPLADGEYTVNLHFAELWFGATDGGIGEVGKRVFDVSLEDRLAEDNLDVYAEVGAEAMLVKSHTVTVTDGVLNIDFDSRDEVGGERHPIINAMEITLAERPFITTIESNEKQIEVYTAELENYNYTVDWGDGSSDTGVTGNIIHAYADDGIYQIAISGRYPRFEYFWDDDKHLGKLISVDQWGTIEWASMEYAFSTGHDFEIRAKDIPDLSQVRSMAGMFATSDFTINDKIKDWDVSKVTDMKAMFWTSSFDQDISNWNVSNVTEMAWMFRHSAFNQDISGWDVGNVTNMEKMFLGSNFDQDLGNWDVSNVTDMNDMFATTALSTENYDATLIGWSSLSSLQNGVAFDAGNSLYCLGEAARQKLIKDYGWTITDGGLNCFFGQLSVVEFVLVNADTEEDIFTITDGMQIDMSDLSTQNLDIRAETGSATESVGFELSGTQSIARRENIPPYALFQDLPIGDYIGHEFSIGRYFLSAMPYSENNLKGEAGDNLSISFEFVDSALAVTSFTLIDAATDKPLFDLTEDFYFTLNDIPSLFLDIRANTSDDVESVRLELTGEQSTARTESLEPYALFRDLPIGDFIGNKFVLGSYTVSATPYSGNNLTGEMGTTLSVDFEIVDTRLSAKQAKRMIIAPNPVAVSTTLSFETPIQLTEIRVFDVMGRMVNAYNAVEVAAEGGYNLNVNDLKSGTYFIVSQDVQGKKYQKQMVVKK